MATNRQDVELRIRARDTSRADLRSLIETLRDLRRAQTEQLDAAKQGSATLSELEQSYKRLESVGKSLLNQQGLITTWRQQAEALDAARQRTQAAQQALTQYQATLEGVARRTTDQKDALTAHNKELKTATAAEALLEKQIGRTADSLQQYGIGLQRLDLDQRRVREALGRVNEALASQDTAIEGYHDNLREVREAERQRTEEARAVEQALRQQEESVKSLQRAEEERQRNIDEVEAGRQAALQENAAREYARWWEEALAQRDAAEQAQAQRTAEIQREEQEQVRRQTEDYKRWWSDALDQIEAKERSAASDQATAQKLAEQRRELQQVADEALNAERGYTAVALAVEDLDNKATPAADAIKRVLDPASEARSTIEGLENEISDLGKTVSQINGPIQNLRGTLEQLSQAQRAIGQQGQMIDNFRQQMVAVSQAREEYAEARGEVRRLADEMRHMDAPTSEMSSRMNEAQRNLRNAATAMQNQMQRARELRNELRGAGIDTRNLAEAEQRLVTAANDTTQTVNALREAHARYGEQVKRTRDNVLQWGEGERTTLSYLQRIRGEILGLATSYIGLQGGVRLANRALDAFRANQQLEQRLLTANSGDLREVGEEMDFVREQADRLGFSYISLGASYSKFAIAARASGWSQEDTRFAFQTLTELARAQKLDDQSASLMMLAIEQMISKDSVMSEELRRQLGDHLPGAVALFAESTGRTVPELMDAMEKGAVTGREVLDFVNYLAERNQTALAEAMSALAASEGRLRNAVDLMMIQLSESGFVDEYQQFLDRLVEALRGPEGEQLAETLGAALLKVTEALVWAVENVETMQTVLSILATGVAIKFFISLAGAIGRAVTMATQMVGILRTLPALFTGGASAAAAWGVGIQGAARLGARAIPLVGAALIAWDIGKIMYQQSDMFAYAIEYVIATFSKLEANITRIVGVVAAAVQDILTGAVRMLGRHVNRAVAGTVNTLAGLLDRIPGQSALTDSLRSFSSDLTAESRDMWSNTQRVWEEGQNAVDAANQRFHDHLRQRAGETAEIIEQADTRVSSPGPGVTPEQRAANALNVELDRLQAQLDRQDMASQFRAERDDLAAQFALVEQEFAGLRAQAAALDGQARIEAEARIEEQVQRRRAIIQRDFETRQSRSRSGSDDRRLRAAQNLTNKLAELEAGLALDMAKADPNIPYLERLTATLNKVRQEYDKVYQSADALEKLGDRQGAAAARERLDLLQQTALEQAKFTSDQDELNRLQDVMNARLQLRESLLQNLNTLHQGGIMSQQELVRRTDEVNTNMAEMIRQAEEAVRVFAEANRHLLDAEGYAALVAQLDGVRATLDTVGRAYTEIDRVAVQSFVNNSVRGIESMADALARVALQIDSLSEGFVAAGQAAAMFFAQLLRDIAIAILRQMILNALVAFVGGGNPMGAAAISMGGQMPMNHTGGIAGARGGMARKMPYLSQATRSSGLPGLGSNEMMSIVEKDEEILTRDDPRHILNQGRGNGASEQPRGLTVALVEDRRDILASMASSEGDEVIFKSIKKNVKAVRSLIGR